MYQRGSFVGTKWSGREAKGSPQSSDEVKNAWSYTYTPIWVHDVHIHWPLSYAMYMSTAA